MNSLRKPPLLTLQQIALPSAAANPALLMSTQPVWRVGCLLSCTLIWTLSCNWFLSIAKGMLKLLRGGEVDPITYARHSL